MNQTLECFSVSVGLGKSHTEQHSAGLDGKNFWDRLNHSNVHILLSIIKSLIAKIFFVEYGSNHELLFADFRCGLLQQIRRDIYLHW